MSIVDVGLLIWIYNWQEDLNIDFTLENFQNFGYQSEIAALWCPHWNPTSKLSPETVSEKMISLF